MTKEDLIRKLTSRKFWAAVVAFVSALLVAFNVSEASITQVTAIIMAFGSLLAYIFTEGWVDAAREKSDSSGDVFNSYYTYPKMSEDDANETK